MMLGEAQQAAQCRTKMVAPGAGHLGQFDLLDFT